MSQLGSSDHQASRKLSSVSGAPSSSAPHEQKRTETPPAVQYQHSRRSNSSASEVNEASRVTQQISPRMTQSRLPIEYDVKKYELKVDHPQCLFIKASPFRSSPTADIGDDLLAKIKKQVPRLRVIERDFRVTPVPILTSHLLPGLMGAPTMDETQREYSNISGDFIEELRDSTVVIICCPTVNYHVPASLKAWIDMVVISGQTFRYYDGKPQGLCGDRKTYVVTTADSDQKGNPVVPFMKAILRFIGIRDVEVLKTPVANEALCQYSLENYSKAMPFDDMRPIVAANWCCWV